MEQINSKMNLNRGYNIIERQQNSGSCCWEYKFRFPEMKGAPSSNMIQHAWHMYKFTFYSGDLRFHYTFFVHIHPWVLLNKTCYTQL